MRLIPAIDLKGGKCVRLRQGRDDATTVYSGDPEAVAREWVRQGARDLHIVNLDGAFGRESENLDILRRIAESTTAAVQFGGGLRTREAAIEALSAGADKIVLGTAAVEDPGLVEGLLDSYGAARVIIALDARKGKVVSRGWVEETGEPVLAMAQRMKRLGVREILYTDTSRDGMMEGPDIDTLNELLHVGIGVIASGGIGSMDDLRALKDLHDPGLAGVIIGKALYEGRIDLQSAVKELGDSETH
jgi:phosphoribosylformimino-5-aminoimidazole carboxamide ribotide isomerase